MRPVLFLSDLHFHRAETPGGRALLRVLGGSRDAEAIYLVGDVFDFWLGHRSTLYRAAFPLLRCLADLVDAGVAVHLFSGNHDPDPGDFFGEIGVHVHEEALGVRLGDFRVWMEHGDTIDPRGWRHRLVCKAVRHPVPRRIARLVPPAVLWGLSRAYSRAATHTYGEPLPPALLHTYVPGRAREGADVVIMGHYHRAAHHRLVVDGRPVRFYALGDWVQQHTWLRYDGDFHLMRDQGPDAPPIELPEGDHGPA